jgi:hypothetical protein
VDAKSNEIPAVRELLEAFADLAGAVIRSTLLRLDGPARIAAASRHHARDRQRTLKLLHAP